MANFWKPRDSCSKSELDIFSQRPVQTDIEGWNFTDIYPLNNVKNSTGPIQFNIEGSNVDYIDMDNTMLCLKVKVVKQDGENLDDAAKVFPVNNWMHSLFSDITCTLNNTQIEGGSHLYPYKAYLTNLLLYGENAKKCQLQTSGYAKDTAGKFNAEDNAGAITRKAWIKGSRVHDLIGPLHLDICQQGKLIINQVNISLKLHRSKPEFNLISFKNGATDPISCLVKIEEAYLKVRRVQVAADTIRSHETGLELQNALYPIQRTKIHTCTVAAGTMSHVQENLFHGKLPKLLVLGLVNNEDFNGHISTNPFCFRHKGLTHVGLYRDGIPIPHNAFTPNFDDAHYGEEYMGLMDALDVAGSDEDVGITKNDYGNGYTLFAFNLSPDKVVSGHGQAMRNGNLRISLKFKAALDKAINIVVMAIYDDEIQISRHRKVAMEASV